MGWRPRECVDEFGTLKIGCSRVAERLRQTLRGARLSTVSHSSRCGGMHYVIAEFLRDGPSLGESSRQQRRLPIPSVGCWDELLTFGRSTSEKHVFASRKILAIMHCPRWRLAHRDSDMRNTSCGDLERWLECIARAPAQRPALFHAPAPSACTAFLAIRLRSSPPHSAATMPPPGGLSMMNCCPTAWAIFGTTVRAVISPEPAGAKATTIRMGSAG